ncbi:MAG: bifunctional metallophosphatase/5'-nucleotidase [Candidatus Gastranaerophilaceae bacterium]
MQLEVNKINTWISPKIAGKEKAVISDKYTKDAVCRYDKEKQKVSSALALASLGVLNKTDKANDKQNSVLSKTGEIISPIMQNGKRGNVTSIFYVNDIHGRLSNMEKITTASKEFDNIMPSYVDKLKFSAGDIMLGQNINVNKAANTFLNSNNFLATVVGNHEVDQNMSDFLTSTQSAVYKIMGSNADINKTHKLYNRVIDSYIQEDNNQNKYGIVALMPFDLSLRSANKELFNGLEIDQKEETIKYLQNEVNRFKEEGINRIVVLSHIGYQNDIEIAKSVEGIDIILGGHSHDLVEDLTVGENLVIAKETGAPTIITQAGRDGNYYGILNIEFDNAGEIVKAENIVKPTANLKRDENIQNEFNNILGKPEIVGKISTAEPLPKNNLKEENPHISFLADILKEKYSTDIAFINAGAMRGYFTKGDISTRDIGEIFPFSDIPVIINVSEKELVEAMKYTASSVGNKDGKPGLAQVSGLKYTVSSEGELISLFSIDKNGTEHLIDINNPQEDKKYTMATPSFIARGLDGYSMLNKFDNAETKKEDEVFKDILTKYIHNCKEEINIQKDGRIQIVGDK